MIRRIVGLAAVVLAGALASACDEVPPSAPPAEGPSLAAATTSPFACAFSGNPSLSNASNAYFTVSADRKAASDIIADMQTRYAAGGASAAQDRGYDLLRLVGNVSRAGTGSSAPSGDALTKQAVNCMFDTSDPVLFAGWPTAEQFDFAGGLGAGAGGAYFVRGGSGDPEGPAIANTDATAGAAGNVAALGPSGTLAWRNTAAAVLPRNGILDRRVLVYGEPVAGGYDWRLIPNDATFSPAALVGLCQGSFEDFAMVSQEGVGVIGYQDAADACGTPPPFAALGLRRSGFALLRRLGGTAAELLTPAPLSATALLLSKTIGGSASGAKGDQFTTRELKTVELTYTADTHFPATIGVNQPLPRVSVEVKTPKPPTTQQPVGGVTVSLAVVNNNGTPTGIGTFANGRCVAPAPSMTTTATVGAAGQTARTIVSWDGLCITKTGAIAIIAQSQAANRTGGVGTVKSAKMNVRP